MIMRKRASSILVGVALLLSLAAVTLASGGDKTVPDPVSDWQEAAFNYEYAAEAQESAADEILQQARDVRDTIHEDAGKARRGKLQSGNLQLRSADLLLAASTNLCNASRVWHHAATVAGRETAAGQYFTSAGKESASKSMGLVRRAVELCEQTAIMFADEEEFLNQAGANQKAAGLRERLAKR